VGEALEKGILHLSEEFTRGVAQSDDITFLLVERRRRSGLPSYLRHPRAELSRSGQSAPASGHPAILL
jgi:hypothetical protein